MRFVSARARTGGALGIHDGEALIVRACRRSEHVEHTGHLDGRLVRAELGVSPRRVCSHGSKCQEGGRKRREGGGGALLTGTGLVARLEPLLMRWQLGERQVITQALDEIRVRHVGASEGDRVRVALDDRVVCGGAVVAAVADEWAREGALDLGEGQMRCLAVEAIRGDAAKPVATAR